MRLTIPLSVLLACIVACEQPSPSLELDLAPKSTGLDFDLIDQAFQTHDATEEDLRMTTDEVAKKISGTGEWRPVTLAEIGVGKYEATATTKDDREFSMEVRQNEKGIFWRWTNEDGSSGGDAMITW